MIDAITQPFIEFSFMRRALVGCLALSLGAPPIGVFLMLRRMSLMGDAMSHAILPGAAIGYLLAGLSLFAMSLGGFAAGLAVALAAGLVARSTVLREDASLAAFYLVSLALGVMIVSVRGSNVDLLHVLFGTVLALDDAALILVASIATRLARRARGDLPPARARMLRSAVPALGQRLELADPLRLPRAGRAQPGERLPGARHADGGRHHAAPGGDRALLGRGRVGADRGRGRMRVRREPLRPARSPIIRACPRAPRSSSSPASSISSPSWSASKAGSSGASCRASISKPDPQPKELCVMKTSSLLPR